MDSKTEVLRGHISDGSSQELSETYVRDIKFVCAHDDGSEKLSEPAAAFFDMKNTKTDMITMAFVVAEHLGPVKKYEEREIRTVSSPLSTDPVRIVGEVEARWRGVEGIREGQALFLGRKFYKSRFLIIDVDVKVLFDACFSSETIEKFGLSEKPSLSTLM